MHKEAVGNAMRNLAIGGASLLLFVLVMFPTSAFAASETYYSVKVDTGYLALRTAPAYDDSNVIGELYTGDIVDVIDTTSNDAYWKVYSPKLDKTGWVNEDYLVYMHDSEQGDYTVHVDTGYLALRTAPAYDDSNIIGQLNNGDTVALLDDYEGEYWWVYSPKLDKQGYVNKDYLTFAEPSHDNYTVKVDSGYLALRTAPEYDDSNIIGQLNTGDVVVAKNEYSGQYWWVYAPKLGREGYVDKRYLV